MPALDRAHGRAPQEHAGRRRTNPEGGNRGVSRWGRNLYRYGDWSDRTRRRDDGEVRGTGVMWGGCTLAKLSGGCFRGGHGARNRLIHVKDASVRYRVPLPESRRSVWTCRNTRAHAAARCAGGARTGALRGRTAMTIIGAPQCRQMKAARTAGPVASGWGVEAGGQRVRKKAAHDLVRARGHGLVAGAPLRAIVLPAEGDAALIERNEPLVGDGHAMRV